ncbi:MAG: MarR family transcriptional regulator [Fusobacteriaceae bacterium]|nr:MarR family transcriptional regulator [Fusobacteriaceae bacterium]MBP6322776.1 MarR family transcriptional regulator [Fusobacteriaceae bacterium]MBP9510837.1 MarR family transcriptional regulator [Fusobacteriaceae bacterium]
MDLRHRDTIGRYIGKISRRAHLFLTKELSEHNCDIAPGQLMFLMLLYSTDGVRQDEFSQTFNIDKGNTTKSIKKLEEQGFIFRVRNSEDKRAYNVYLSEKAIELKPVIFSILQKLDDLLGKNLTDKEYEQLISLLKKI